MVLNSTVWVEDLPNTVEAIFQLKGSDPYGVAVLQSRQTHLDFLRTHGLTDAHVPLLELDLGSLQSPGPFRELRNHLLAGTQYSSL